MGGALLAQPNGDIVVTASNGGTIGFLQRYRPSTASFTTLASFPSSTADLFPNGVAMDVDNSGYLVVCRGAVLRMDPQNRVTTLFLAGPNTWLGRGALHPSGDLVLHAYSPGVSNGLYRFSRQGALVSTIVSGPEALRLLSLDVESGDYLVSRGAASDLVRISESGRLSTLASGGGVSWGGIGRDVGRGDFVAGIYVAWSTGWLGRLSDGGAWTTLRSDWNIGEVRIDLPSGDAVCPIFDSSQWARVVIGRFRRDGSVVYTAGSGIDVTACEIDRCSTLVGLGSTAPGGTYTLLLSLPERAGQAYLLASSLSLRPGVTVGGFGLPINVDPLFLASLTMPAVFEGYAGTLDASGRAAARIRIPAITGLRGVRVFTAGITASSAGITGVTSLAAFTIQ
jgi:hypothetical protein